MRERRLGKRRVQVNLNLEVSVNSMKNSLEKLRQKKNMGFTMTEMIVVICIVLILSGILAFSIGRWIDWADFKKQNENAQTLYLAAQNQMTEYSAHGRLEDIVQGPMADNDKVYKNILDFTEETIIDSKGNPVNKEDLWPASKDKAPSAKNKYIGTVCYVMGTADDYAAYVSDPEDFKKDKPEVSMMYDVLTPYLYDPSILSATICMEFTPEEGQVYSVLYSDYKADENIPFTYKANQKREDGQVSIDDRRGDYRKDRMVGYYGVDTLSKIIGTNREKLAINNTHLTNSNTQYLSFNLKDTNGAITQMTYTIVIYNSATNEKCMEIELDGSKLLPAGATPATANLDDPFHGKVECVTRRYTDANGDPLGSPVEQTFPFIVDREGFSNIRLLLDAADLSATEARYYAIYDELTGSTVPASTEELFNAYKNTYSFSRLGISAEEIYCTVQGTGSVYKTTSAKQSNSSSAYFANENLAKTPDTYTISNGRHLYNVRYLENIPGKEGNTRTYQLVKDVDWAQFTAGGNLYYTSEITPRSRAASGSLIGALTASDEKAVNEGITGAALDVPFPSIWQLGEKATFTSISTAPEDISGLIINGEDNVKLQLYATRTPLSPGPGYKLDDFEKNGPVGLFAVNKGTIKNVNLKKITVAGLEDLTEETAAGAFCGVNEGDLEGLTVGTASDLRTNTKSKITGSANVGGITGLHKVKTGTDERDYKNLKNYGDVIGAEKNIGGIVGNITLDAIVSDKKVTIENCENYGAIQAAAPADPTSINKAERAKVQCIGGIVGTVENKTGTHANVTIKDCIGSPRYTESEGKTIFDATAEGVTEKLNGVYVGGIVGFNDGGVITGCHSKNAGGKEKGYLFGYKYVGGIVGYNVQGTVKNELSGNANVNSTNVVGYEYVGGICGANASMSSTEDGDDHVTLPENDPSNRSNILIQNWTNEGMVAAVNSYAGGITGYNAGQVEDCAGNVSASNTAKMMAGVPLLQKGNYVGGIAGYNSGDVIVTGTTRQEVTSFLTGDSYLGGVIGYNDVGAELKGYDLDGGFIRGTGSFVGGLIGLNASEEIFEDDENAAVNNPVESDPNEVSGTFYVGGVLGGNVVPVNGDKYIRYRVDNYLGNIMAQAFAGGHIGYNTLIDGKVAGTDYAQTVKDYAEALKTEQKNAWSEETGTRTGTWVTGSSITDGAVGTFQVFDEQEEELSSKSLKSNEQLYIVGGLDTTPCYLNSLSCEQIYAGGVVGYNAGNTYLTIQNIINKTPVNAKHYVSHNSANGTNVSVFDTYYNDNSYDGSKQYSYSGGIMGKVTKNTQVVKCQSQGEGAVSNRGGSYLGAICEVNEGHIEECTVSTIGMSSQSNVGGIAGLNKEDAEILRCILPSGVTVTGSDCVGGLVADNFGTVEDPALQGGAVDAKNGTKTASNAGGAVGQNNGLIKFTKEAEVEVQVSAASKNAGGIAGINGSYNGSGSAGTTGKMQCPTTEKVTVSGSVSAAKYAGGVVGYNNRSEAVSGAPEIDVYTYTSGSTPPSATSKEHAMLYNWVNNATVTAEKGGAGGITAYSNDAYITACENKQPVTAVSYEIDGSSSSVDFTLGAGGIVAYSKGTYIDSCTNTGSISAPECLAGGIVGNVIGSSVQNCNAEKDSVAAASAPRVTGKYTSGGIAGKNENNALLYKNTVSDVEVYNTSDSINARPADGFGYAGGVVGMCTNGGRVYESKVADVKVRSVISGEDSGIGGAVGFANNGSNIENVTVTGGTSSGNDAVVGFDGTPKNTSFANIGGIAGRIQNVFVKNCHVSANVAGDMGSTDGNTGVGGVVGYALTCNISNCTYSGDLTANGTSDNMVAMGGIAGLVSQAMGDSSISECNIGRSYDPATGDLMPDKTVIEAGKSDVYGGYLGGIVGRAIQGASIVSCGPKYDINNDNDQNAPATPTQIAGGLDTIVTIQNYIGDTGGIVGNMDVGTLVKECTTGSDWEVIARSYIISTGTGGIIGYSSSGEDIEDCVNCANVKSNEATSDNIAVGGLIGRMENNAKNGMVIKKFINFGVIQGTIAGGAVGRLKFKCPSFVECKNYGKIISDNSKGKSKGAGGIVANFFSNDDEGGVNYAAFVSCENHGNIEGAQNLGGIVGYAGNDSYVNIAITDCVNTGAIKKTTTDNKGKLGGIMSTNGNAKVTIDRCRNYGNFKGEYKNKEDDDEDVILEFANKGIFGNKGKSLVTIGDCFSFANYTGISPDTSSEVLEWSGDNYFYYAYCQTDNAVKRHMYSSQDDIKNQKDKKAENGNKLYYFKNSEVPTTSGTNELHIDKKISSTTIAKNLTWEPSSSDYAKDFDSQYDWRAYDKRDQRATGRQKRYLDIDINIEEYYDEKTKGKVDTASIKNLEVKNVGGQFLITWDHDADEYKADQLIYKTYTVDPASKEETDVQWSSVLTIDHGIQQYMLSDLDIKGDYIAVYVRSIGEDYVVPSDYSEEWRTLYGPERNEGLTEGDLDWKEKENCTSEWGKAESDKKETLPTPKIHLELVPVEDDAPPTVEPPKMGEPEVTDEPNEEGNLEEKVYQFVAVLENASEFKGTEAEIEINGLPGPNGIANESNSQTVTFNAEDGISESFSFRNWMSRVLTYVARAKTGSGYVDSPSASYTVTLYDGRSMHDYPLVATDFKDFTGSDFADLSNTFHMEYDKGHTQKHKVQGESRKDGKNKTGEEDENINTDLYMDAELVVDDYKIGLDSSGKSITLPVALAYNNSHVAYYSASGIDVSLNGLPEDLVDYGNITLRVYPWQGQSKVCQYGHKVMIPSGSTSKESLTEEELLDYIANTGDPKQLVDTAVTVTESGGRPVFVKKDGKVALNTGYVLRKNSDGTYSIIYSAILAYRNTYANQIDEKVYAVDHKENTVVSGESGEDGYFEAKIQPKPVILTEGSIFDTDTDTYTFKWDRGTTAFDVEAVYEVRAVDTVTGRVLGSADVNKGKAEAIGGEGNDQYWQCKFQDPDNTWNASNITFIVVRKGEVDTSGKTKAFSSTASEDYKIKKRLSRITAPVVSLSAYNSEAETDKDTLKYYVRWQGITDKDEQDALAGYKVLIETKDGVLISEQEYPNLDEGTVEGVNGGKSYERQIDLNGCTPGSVLHISVQALAKDESDSYIDGPKGEVREMTLPVRQSQPQINKLTSTPVYTTHNSSKWNDATTFMTAEEFAEGLLLQLKGDPVSTDARGSYELAVAVYDKKPTDEQEKDASKVAAGDVPEDPAEGTVYWNTGATKTLIYKEDRELMDGVLTDAEYRLTGLESEDAGKWLKIALRNVADNNISSWWTDEDEGPDPTGTGGSGTVNYCWVQIPRIQLETVSLSQEQTSVFYNPEKNQWSMNALTGHNVEEAVQTTLAFNLVDHADGYRLQIVGRSKDLLLGSTAYDTTEAGWLYLEPVEIKDDAGNVTGFEKDKYNVFAATTQDGSKKSEPGSGADTVPKCKQDPLAVYRGTISKGTAEESGMLQLPFTYKVLRYDGDTTGFETVSVLVWEDDTIRFILPGAETVKGSGGKEYALAKNSNVEQVSFQPVILTDEQLLRYENGGIVNWYATLEGSTGKYAYHTKMLDDYGDAPSSLIVNVGVSGHKELAYDVTTTAASQDQNRQIYRVTVRETTDVSKDDNILDRRYLSACTGKSDPTSILLPLSSEIYRAYSGKYIQFECAVIASDGNIGQWSAATTPPGELLTLAGTPVKDMNPTESTLAGVLSKNEGTSSSGTNQTVKANIYKWEHKAADTGRINGYTVQIGTKDPVMKWVLNLNDDGNWCYVDEESKQIPLNDSSLNIPMTSGVFVTPAGSASTETYDLAVNATLTMTSDQTTGNVIFTLTVPVETQLSVPAISTDPLTFAFDTQVKVDGWKYYP